VTVTIEVRDYDPAWPALAAGAIAELRAAMPVRIGAVEHVGSTAVPGLAAKPVIDLMAATEDLDGVVAHERALLDLEYRRLETGMPERLFYRRAGYHLHVVTSASWPTRNERLLREHLLADPAARAEYAQLKRELAGSAADGDAYTRGKTALIQRLVDAARAARGLPRVDVWEQ
jgi:GrpB-like predicted nucleotidyltransferase (UPF0157 family)